ncbi:hypothetical protein A1O3_03828 [Capronia epimyces CBS 606.96]|uniref:Uncharacterized protein n=1 Tax=Capronia epimyces CBS 606.96 TaxID=1182542 RepID=W9YX72_9EURO|nr:uncharacterized protein A1O3_03828 [Capronia epimyces CBS 606.96]EXJ86874.1 hypothetical protein A1O3_03828 [Capronia epimyces CBS 606.96]
MSEPQQTPTPEKTPGKKPSRPAAPERSISEVSTTSGDDQGYESRSRSQSRRRRRQNQRQRKTAQGGAQAGNASAQSMASIDEGPESQQQQPQPPQQQWLTNPDPRDITEAQPFERIKPPSESMVGPVTYARMLRGEIPWRGAPPTQPLDTAKPNDAKDSTGKDPMDQDGLKLRLELNLDIEIELKASIHGDLTLALL